MSIFNHFSNINLSNDQEAALKMLEIFIESPKQIFMLKGYAGTGKTTLLKGITQYLDAQKKHFQVMAPTGRAAKILREKTGFGKTIHSSIYDLDRISFLKQDEKLEKQSFKFNFPLIELEEETIIIVDESSLISSRESKHELFSFGTDILLQDLLTYSKVSATKNKIIFVGDPAQLPPVGDDKSWAFIPQLFQKKNLEFVEIELKEVKRQADNLILSNANKLRNCINDENPATLELDFDTNSYIKINPEDAITKYVELFPIPEVDNGVIISYSNRQCYFNNMAIRSKIFPNKLNVCSGDVIQIISNNYRTYPTEIFNGDFAKIIYVSEGVTSLSAPVWTEGIKETIVINYRKVIIRINKLEFEAMIIDDLLHSTERDLSIKQMKAIYINFIMRFDDEQIKREKSGLPKYKRYSSEFSDMLINDKYYNAIRCKFGYAITCHKAQGGEWDTVFVDYSGRVSLKKDPLRWSYTATTRGANQCFAINPPQFNRFSKFQVYDIANITTFPLNALDFKNTIISPFHTAKNHLCVSYKYWEILEKLENTNYIIKSIKSTNWLEKYEIQKGENTIILEGHYNNSGFFKNGFNVVSECDEILKNEIEALFNKNYNYNFDIKYYSENKNLSELYAIMQDYCTELEIKITNIEENNNNYFVNYYLKTESVCAYIQFYYNIKFELTKALPRSYDEDNDTKLIQLIEKLNQYAS
jgi:tRNA A37 threonylcarbamoyladenosine biosynthesis protein TsaE